MSRNIGEGNYNEGGQLKREYILKEYHSDHAWSSSEVKFHNSDSESEGTSIRIVSANLLVRCRKVGDPQFDSNGEESKRKQSNNPWNYSETKEEYKTRFDSQIDRLKSYCSGADKENTIFCLQEGLPEMESSDEDMIEKCRKHLTRILNELNGRDKEDETKNEGPWRYIYNSTSLSGQVFLYNEKAFGIAENEEGSDTRLLDVSGSNYDYVRFCSKKEGSNQEFNLANIDASSMHFVVIPDKVSDLAAKTNKPTFVVGNMNTEAHYYKDKGVEVIDVGEGTNLGKETQFGESFRIPRTNSDMMLVALPDGVAVDVEYTGEYFEHSLERKQKTISRKIGHEGFKDLENIDIGSVKYKEMTQYSEADKGRELSDRIKLASEDNSILVINKESFQDYLYVLANGLAPAYMEFFKNSLESKLAVHNVTNIDLDVLSKELEITLNLPDKYPKNIIVTNSVNKINEELFQEEERYVKDFENRKALEEIGAEVARTAIEISSSFAEQVNLIMEAPFDVEKGLKSDSDDLLNSFEREWNNLTEYSSEKINVNLSSSKLWENRKSTIRGFFSVTVPATRSSKIRLGSASAEQITVIPEEKKSQYTEDSLVHIAKTAKKERSTNVSLGKKFFQDNEGKLKEKRGTIEKIMQKKRRDLFIDAIKQAHNMGTSELTKEDKYLIEAAALVVKASRIFGGISSKNTKGNLIYKKGTDEKFHEEGFESKIEIEEGVEIKKFSKGSELAKHLFEESGDQIKGIFGGDADKFEKFAITLSSIYQKLTLENGLLSGRREGDDNKKMKKDGKARGDRLKYISQDCIDSAIAKVKSNSGVYCV